MYFLSYSFHENFSSSLCLNFCYFYLTFIYFDDLELDERKKWVPIFLIEAKKCYFSPVSLTWKSEVVLIVRGVW